MKTSAEFRSPHFPPYNDEESLVNPGRWGKRLAEYLKVELEQIGVKTEDIFAEDFGWILPIVNHSFPLHLACGNIDGSTEEFLVFIDPSTPTLRRGLFKKVSTEVEIAALSSSLYGVLDKSDKFSEVRWS